MTAGSAPALSLPGARRLWLLASGWFLLNALTPLLFSRTAETDQAAELVRSQLWQWGYGSQPPLYTWLVRLLLQLSGPALWPLLLLKAALLSGLAAGLLLIGRHLGFSRAQQWISVVGLTLIPQFAWESQRDLTHSVLATLLACLTLLQLLRLEARPSPANYALAGALAAGGILSKYTFAVFLLGTLLAGLSLPAFRRRLLRPGILIALAVFAVLLAPHLLWILQQPELALGGTEKLRTGGTFPLSLLQGLGSAGLNALGFLTPLWIVGLLLIAGRPRPAAGPGQLLLTRLPIAMAIVLSLVILLSGATRIKDRWFQNLLFYAPALLAVLSGPSPPPRRLRVYLQTGAVAALAVSAALPGRIPLAGALGRTSSFNAPLVELLGDIRRQEEEPLLVITSDSFLGGNARRVFAGVPVIPAQALARFQDLPGGSGDTVLLVAAADDREGRGLDGLLADLGATGLRTPPPQHFRPVSAPSRWAPDERYTLFVLALPAGELGLKGPPGAGSVVAPEPFR